MTFKRIQLIGVVFYNQFKFNGYVYTDDEYDFTDVN